MKRFLNVKGFLTQKGSLTQKGFSMQKGSLSSSHEMWQEMRSVILSVSPTLLLLDLPWLTGAGDFLSRG